MMTETARIFDHYRAVALIMSSPDPSAHKRIGRGVRKFDSAVCDKEKHHAMLAGTYAKFKRNPAIKITF